MTLYPLRFQPIFKSMLWGGQQLPEYLRCSAPSNDPIGEAWVLSDVEGNISTVTNGSLSGKTLREVIAENPHGVFGKQVPADGKFPLLLKFIDAKKELSVQVHPNDEQAIRLKGRGQRGKTEAWVILSADPATSRLYAGFQPGTTAETFRTAMSNGTVPSTLAAFTPKPGDCLFLEAGTVHAIGADILLFEVQQTSDITYRLYDWDRVDAKTGQPRELHIDAGLECSDFARGPVKPVVPAQTGDRASFVRCEYFRLDQMSLSQPQMVGAVGACEVVVCVGGRGRIGSEVVQTGDVLLLPAALGEVAAVPEPNAPLKLLVCGL
jgi:mannose-6-phosphate isomerase